MFLELHHQHQYMKEILLVWNINEFPLFYYDPIRQIGDLTEKIL